MPNLSYRYAAVDIGSNAVRLLLCNAVEEHGVVHFKKNELVRIPLRLGEDVFEYGKISSEKSDRLVKTMHAFKLLIDVFEPISFRACATASFREAANSESLVNRIQKTCGLSIEIISGKEEARLIYTNHVEAMLDPEKSYLYIDVGGGSTELTLFYKNKLVASQSFNVGTIRWLKEKVSKEVWESMKDWVRKQSEGHSPLIAIGSGGNINKIFKLIDRRTKPLAYSKLKEFYDLIKDCTIEDRMEIWQLNPDRADVIVPAAKIYLTMMKMGGIETIIVPTIGLSDGIIHQLHEDFIKTNSKGPKLFQN